MAARCPMPETNTKTTETPETSTMAAPAVRPATSDDIPAMARVHATSFDAHAAWSADALADLLATPGTFALVSGDTDITGFILMRAAAGEAEVLTLAVDPLARRKGQARALVLGAITAVLAADCASVFLEVAEDNAAARALYGALGFSPAGTRKAYYSRPGGQAVDGLVLRWQA